MAAPTNLQEAAESALQPKFDELRASLVKDLEARAGSLYEDAADYARKEDVDLLATTIRQGQEAIAPLLSDHADGKLSQESMLGLIAEPISKVRTDVQGVLDEMQRNMDYRHIQAAEKTGNLIKLQASARGGGEIAPRTATARALVARRRGETSQNELKASSKERLAKLTVADAEAHFDALRIRMGRRELDDVLWSMLERIKNPDNNQNPVIGYQDYVATNGELALPEDIAGRAQALTGEAATDGDNWTPILVDAENWAEMQTAREQLHPYIMTKPMAQREQDIPSFDSDVNAWFLTPAGQDYTNSRAVAATETQVTRLTAHEFSQWRWLGQFFASDSVVNVAAELDQLFIKMAGETLDAIILNSDPTATEAANVNPAAPATGVNRQAFASGINGVRAYCDDTAAVQLNVNAALSDTSLIKLRALLGHAGKAPGGQIVVTGTAEYFKLLEFDLYRRMDAFGAMAAVSTGELRDAFRMPIICPEPFPLAFASDGKVSTTGANNTTGAIVTLAPEFWVLGMRLMPQMIMRGAYGTQPSGTYYGMVMRTGFSVKNAQSIRSGRQPAALARNITRS